MAKTFEDLDREAGLLALDREANQFNVSDNLPIRRPEGTRGLFDNPNKMLDNLLGTENLDDFMPFDAKFDFGRIIQTTTEPTEAEDKVKLSILYKSIADIDPKISFNMMDELNKIIVGGDIKPSAMWKHYQETYKETKTYVDALKHGYRRAGVMMTKQLAGIAKIEAEVGGMARDWLWGALGREKPQYSKDIDEKLGEWSDMMLAGVQEYYQTNKKEAIQIVPGLGYRDTILQYVFEPKNLIQGIIESSPLILEGILGGVFGGAGAGITTMAMPIAGGTYAEARDEGTEPLPALAQSMLTGVGEATIEQWTLGKKLGLLKNFPKMVAQGLPKLLWEGVKTFFRGTAEEGSQEFNRNFWQWVFTDRSQQWSENVAESAAAGGPMELVMGGAFAATGAAVGAVVKDQQAARLDQIAEAVETEPTLTETHKVEIRKELDKVETAIENDEFVVDEEAAPEGIEVPTEPSEAITAPEGEIVATEAKPTEKVVEQKAARPVEKKITEKTDAELLDQRQPIKEIDKARRTPEQIKTLTEVEDELVGRHEPETTDISKATRKKAVKETAEAIINDDIYQTALEAQEVQAEQVGEGGIVFFEEGARGEVTEAIENHPILKGHITFDRASKAPSWDQVVQRGGGDQDIDISEFLENFARTLEGKKQADGINMAALQEAVDMQEFTYLEVLDIKYDMLKKGFAAADINDTIKQWAIDNEVDVEMVEGEYLPIEGKQDVKSKQEILRELEKEHRKTQRKVQVPEQVAITKARQLAFKSKEPYYVYERTGKQAGTYAVTKQPPKQGEYKKVSPPKAGEIESKVEEDVAGISPEEQKAIKKLRQRIHATATVKGMTKKALSDLKLKHTRYRTLSGKVASRKITIKQLETLLKAVQRTRPKQIGYKKVITKKTENKIQSLKNNLKKKLQMTDKAYKEILKKEIRGREPKYIDAKHFVTEKQGKDIIKRMHDAAEVLKARVSFDNAVEKNPEIAKEVKRLQTEISQKSKRDPYRTESMRYYAQQSEIRTGAPIFTMYTDLIDTNLEAHRTRHARIAALENKVPGFKEIASEEAALNRVSQYIASKGTQLNRPAAPTNITKNEIKLAEEIQKIFKDYELKARVSKFFNWYYYDEGIAEFDKYKKEIHKAEDIYESQGKEELIKYLRTQEWGVIKSGYEPLESVVLKIRPYKTGPKTVGKTHIKIRTDIEYHAQERNILQRLNSYTRQMDMLYNLSPKINAFVRLYEDNLTKFADPGKVQESIEHFLSNLKKYNIEGNWIGDIMARLYAQASQIIIMAQPVLATRNLFQNAAFEHDKNILFDPRNKNLTPGDIEYMETYVQQLRGMMEEFFMVNEKVLPGTETLMKVLKKIKIYAWSDATNRQWGFWAKMNQVKRAQQTETLPEMMSKAKFEDMSELEQIKALEILARDGQEEMARYVSRVHVDDIHFLYERAQRSPAEMGTMGRVFGNLMLFPRAYTEKLAHQVSKLTNKTSSQQERYRAAKILVSVMAGGILVGEVFSMITGRRNPYNPLNVLGFQLGGLLLGLTDDVNKAYNLSIKALSGDKKALYALTTLLPQMADNFIPFYDWTFRGIEAVTDTKNLDRAALRQILEVIDKEYKSRKGAYTMKRNFVQSLQFFFAGSSIDRKIEEEKRKKKSDFGGIAD